MRKAMRGFIMVAVIVMLMASGAMAQTIYSTGNDGLDLITIDATTGVATTVGSFGIANTYSLAFDNTGALWALVDLWGNVQLATVDIATGAATPVGAPTGISNAIALESDSAGTLYSGAWNGNFYTVNKSTGQLTLVGPMGINAIMDLAFDNSGTLWAVDESGPNSNDLYTINTATGAATFACTLTGVDGDMGLMVDPKTNQMYGTDYYNPTPYLYAIDPVLCTATPIGPGLGVTAPHGGDISPVPINNVPTMNEWGLIIFMLLAGLGAAYFLPRRRNEA